MEIAAMIFSKLILLGLYIGLCIDWYHYGYRQSRTFFTTLFLILGCFFAGTLTIFELYLIRDEHLVFVLSFSFELIVIVTAHRLGRRKHSKELLIELFKPTEQKAAYS